MTNTRIDACGLKRLPRLGFAGTMALLGLSACATGSAQERSGATASPAPTAAVAPAAAPATEQEAPASVPGQGQETPPSRAPPSIAPPSIAPPSRASGAPASGAGSERMLPPCVPVRRAHVRHHKPKQQPPPQSPALTGPPPPPPADAVVDAQVGEVGTSLSSILGKDVKGAKGEDLGRVVDVLADARGHVRVAIIDFGGFLGVGTRRIAVDWPLLRFDPGSRDKPLVLIVDKKKLQSAPEYNSNRPRVLMPPAATDASAADQTKK
jgi:hypothetical protein